MALIAWVNLFGTRLHRGFPMSASPERFLPFLRPVLDKVHAAGAGEGG